MQTYLNHQPLAMLFVKDLSMIVNMTPITVFLQEILFANVLKQLYYYNMVLNFAIM